MIVVGIVIVLFTLVNWKKKSWMRGKFLNVFLNFSNKNQPHSRTKILMFI